MVLDERAGNVGFHEFLKGILCIARIVQVGIIYKVAAQGICQTASLGQMLFHNLPIISVDRAYRQRAFTGELACACKRLFSHCGADIEFLADLIRNTFKFVHDACTFNWMFNGRDGTTINFDLAAFLER